MEQEKQIMPLEIEDEKKSKVWIWVLIAVVLIVLGIGIYYWLSGGDTSPVVDAGNSILRPPDLPE